MTNMKELMELQTKAFINYIETANSIKNTFISSEKITEYRKVLNKYSEVTANLYKPESNETVSTIIEKQVDFLKNVTDYNLSLYKKWYGIK